jgi:hypothetical protein
VVREVQALHVPLVDLLALQTRSSIRRTGEFERLYVWWRRAVGMYPEGRQDDALSVASGTAVAKLAARALKSSDPRSRAS